MLRNFLLGACSSRRLFTPPTHSLCDIVLLLTWHMWWLTSRYLTTHSYLMKYLLSPLQCMSRFLTWYGGSLSGRDLSLVEEDILDPMFRSACYGSYTHGTGINYLLSPSAKPWQMWPGPGPDGTPIWAPINLPPKTRPYKGFDIIGNKLIAGKWWCTHLRLINCQAELQSRASLQIY